METHSNQIEEFSSHDERMGSLPYSDAAEPITAMLARALMYSQDAEREFEQARALKMEAERYRAQVQQETVEKVEALCNNLREKAAQAMEQAHQALEEAQARERASATALQEAERTRAEAETHATKVKAEADEYNKVVRAEAEEYNKAARAEAETEAKAIIERTQADLRAKIRMQHQRVDEEVRRAMSGIEKMQAAVQEELAAQKLFTEALRLRAFAPRNDELDEDLPVLHGSQTAKVEHSRPRVTRQRAAS